MLQARFNRAGSMISDFLLLMRISSFCRLTRFGNNLLEVSFEREASAWIKTLVKI
jgi:hypothetical protein